MMGVKVEVEIGASWFPVHIRFPTIYVGKCCHESSICLEGKGTHSGTGIKKNNSNKKTFGVEPTNFSL